MGDFDIEDCLKESIILYFSHDLNKCQADDLLFWINQKPENLEYFRQLGNIWLAVGEIDEQKFDALKALESIRIKRKRK